MKHLLLLLGLLSAAGAWAAEPVAINGNTVIDAAKELEVRRLDPGLTRQPFAAWLRHNTPPGTVFVWEAHYCGERSAAGPGDPVADFPLCAEVHARLTDGRGVSIAVALGTLKQGVSGDPRMVWALISYPGGNAGSAPRLSELPALLGVQR